MIKFAMKFQFLKFKRRCIFSVRFSCGIHLFVLIATFETANGFTEKLQESFIKRQKIEVRSDIKTVSKRNIRA